MCSPTVDLVEWLWHKTAVPIFVERFLLSVLAGIIVLLLLSNPMKFDNTQRVTGILAVIFLAYFAAHSIHKLRTSSTEGFATVNILTCIQQNNSNGIPVMAGVQGDIRSDGVVTPIDVLLQIQIAAKEKPLNLTSIHVEIKTPSGEWMVLKNLPPGLKLFWGKDNLKIAKEGKLNAPDVVSFLRHDIDPWKSVLGFGLYEFADSKYIPGEGNPTLRVTIENILGEVQQTELKPKSFDPGDPFETPGWAIEIVSDPVDLSQVKRQRFFDK
jgi:hypothetical protein